MPKSKPHPSKSPRSRSRDRGDPPRRAQGHTPSGEWIFGAHAVEAALSNPKRNLRRLVSAGPAKPRISEIAAKRGIAIDTVSKSELDQLLPAESVHQGVAVLSEPLPDIAIEEFLDDLSDPTCLVVVLDQATDPRNVGAVLRSAAAFGASAVVLPERRASGTTGILAKAASGALERVPLIHVVNLARTLDLLKDSGFWSIGLDGGSDTDLRRIESPARCVVVLGSEGEGLRRLTREKCDYLARIAISDAVESLNLSNAAAVALYELARRRPDSR